MSNTLRAAGPRPLDSLDALLSAARLRKLAKATRKAVIDVFGAATRRDAVTERRPASADPELRESENVPLKQDIRATSRARCCRTCPMRGSTSKSRQGRGIGYEINFNRHFYKYVPPRPLA